MEKSFEQLKTMDYFFYYGQSPLDEEIRHDVILGIQQPRRSLFYNRTEGAGIPQIENHPNTLLLQIKIKSAIVSWIGRRNQEGSDGSQGTPNRMIAASQSTITVPQRRRGEVDVSVLYIALADYKQQNLNVPAGVGGTG